MSRNEVNKAWKSLNLSNVYFEHKLPTLILPNACSKQPIPYLQYFQDRKKGKGWDGDVNLKSRQTF
jgi:hypothetical protein